MSIFEDVITSLKVDKKEVIKPDIFLAGYLKSIVGKYTIAPVSNFSVAKFENNKFWFERLCPRDFNGIESLPLQVIEVKCLKVEDYPSLEIPRIGPIKYCLPMLFCNKSLENSQEVLFGVNGNLIETLSYRNSPKDDPFLPHVGYEHSLIINDALPSIPTFQEEPKYNEADSESIKNSVIEVWLQGNSAVCSYKGAKSSGEKIKIITR